MYETSLTRKLVCRIYKFDSSELQTCMKFAESRNRLILKTQRKTRATRITLGTRIAAILDSNACEDPGDEAQRPLNFISSPAYLFISTDPGHEFVKTFTQPKERRNSSIVSITITLRNWRLIFFKSYFLAGLI